MSAVTKKSDTHEERYAHVKIEGNHKVSHATVFARKEFGGDGAFQFSVALCAHGDQFSRAIGRQTARRKYFNHKIEAVAPKFTFDVAQKIATQTAAIHAYMGGK